MKLGKKMSNKKSLLLIFTALIFSFASQISYGQDKTNGIKNPNKYYWVIYDDECPYCKSAYRKIRFLDWTKKFKFISYKDPKTYEIFPNLSKEECAVDIHMVTPTGEVLKSYNVFKTIINNLFSLKLFKPILNSKFGERKLEKYYRSIVEKRTCYYSMSESCD